MIAKRQRENLLMIGGFLALGVIIVALNWSDRTLMKRSDERRDRLGRIVKSVGKKPRKKPRETAKMDESTRLKRSFSPKAHLTSSHTDDPPVIDGKLDEPVWDEAGVTSGFVHHERRELAVNKTTVYALHDTENLYLAFVCYEPGILDLKMDVAERDGPLWNNDCVEVFIDGNCDAKTYHHLIVSAAGTVYDAAFTEEFEGKNKAWDGKWKASAYVGKKEWQVEMAIPFGEIGAGTPGPRKSLGVNFNRERYARKTELTSWSSTFGGFHEPERFGRLGFDEGVPRVEVVDLGRRRRGKNILKLGLINGELRPWRLRVEMEFSGSRGRKEITLAPSEEKLVEFSYGVTKSRTYNMVLTLIDLTAKKERILWRTANLPITPVK